LDFLTGVLGFDITAALTSALSTVVTDFTGNLQVIIPAVLGLAAVLMVWRRVRAQVH
jgi:uncharacterized membrane protein YeaQ/YmgE (transglycosylase-associated protein family)